MLTLFTIPKAFHGHTGVIQRNAIKSWTMLRPECEVILLADDEGTAEVAKEFGVKHIPDIARNDFGTPLLNCAFEKAEAAANYSILCHVNADIILMSDFTEAVSKVNKLTSRFLITGQRRDLEVTHLLDFENGWEEKLLCDVHEKGRLHHFTGVDFWAYSKGVINNMPPFAVGRIATESWLMYKTRLEKADLIDATDTIVSVHQNHDYSHHPDGLRGIGTGVEAQRNRELVGGKSYFFIIKDRTHVLTPRSLERVRDLWWIWRSIRTFSVLHPSAFFPLRIGLKAVNGAIDGARQLGKRLGVRRPYKINIDLPD